MVLELGTVSRPSSDDAFAVRLSSGPLTCSSFIVATGGKSIPKIGATGLGYTLAQQFGLRVTETRPALVPLTFEPRILERLGARCPRISTEAIATANGKSFREALLFTHRGLSGPAILHFELLARARVTRSASIWRWCFRSPTCWPKRAGQRRGCRCRPFSRHSCPSGWRRCWPDIALGASSATSPTPRSPRWRRIWGAGPSSPPEQGFRTAEVTLGGVDTRDLDSTTLAARQVPGCISRGMRRRDGRLGGYNFQWAWSSGCAAGQVA